MAQYPDQFIMTLAESVFAMPNQLFGYAMDIEAGKRVPRIVMSPGYAITSDMVLDVMSIKDATVKTPTGNVTAYQAMLDYDLPGYTDALNVTLQENGLDTIWVPTV